MYETFQDGFVRLRDVLGFAPDWLVALVLLALGVTLAVGAHRIAMQLLGRTFGQRSALASILTNIEGPTRLAVVVLALSMVLPTAPLSSETSALLLRLILLTVIGVVGWTVIVALRTFASLHLLRFRIDTEDNLLARKHVTQVRILLRTADVLVIIITVAVALMTFEPVRQYGVSLFASAGVAGLVAGLAARPVLSNLFAGVQLAVTQPIRIDDAVLVENEFGHVEEITSTYVVVRLWDLRRLIVPLTYFIEKPFQNWTREGAALVGSVILYLDFTAPIDRIREKAKEIAERSPHWNRQVFNVQVTDAKDSAIEVRILVSGNSSGATGDLRCEMREKLIAFLVREHPYALPRSRQIAETQRNDNDGADASPEVQSPPLSTARARRG